MHSGQSKHRTTQITPEDYELAMRTISRMIAQWWDGKGHRIRDAGHQQPDDDSTAIDND